MESTLAEVSFGEWLRRRRKAAGRTQEQLAQQISCSTSALKKIEAEERRPSLQIVERLAEIFNIPQKERTAFLRFARGDWQSAPVIESEDAPWRAPTTSARSNLPAPLTFLIGREHEVDKIQECLSNPSIRLVTLIGPPGIGKTSLSLEVARELVDSFVDGVFFVPLAPLDDPNLVTPTIVQSLGLIETKHAPSMERLKDGIGEKQMLIVLDNFEHLINEAAPFIPDLLLACPRLKILITSREALRVPGEWLHPVQTLDVPALNLPEASSEMDLETISQFSALRLFAERARAVRADFALNDDNVQAVAAICAQLDGLPLAIELIAARIRLMSPQTLLTKLNDQFVLYVDGMRARSTRQKTMHNAIDWSYNLLSAEEQSLFVQLSVFSGGFTLDAADSIFSRTAMDKSIPDLIASLLDKSLLQRTWNERGEPRFHMLVTIQQFALNHLRERNTETEVRNWHFDYFLNLAEESEPHMSGHGQVEWLALLQPEMNNFRAAFEWKLGVQKDTEQSLRLVGALFQFWRVRSDFYEAQHWLDIVLNLSDAKNYPTAYARALLGMGILKLIYIDAKVAEPLLLQTVTLAHSLEDKSILAEALDFLGLAHGFQKKFVQAHNLLEESQSLFRAVNHRNGLALTNWHLGWVADFEGKQTAALEFLKQALLLFQEGGDLLRQSILLRQIGRLLLIADEWRQGSTMLRQALRAAYRVDSKLEMGHTFAELSLAEEHMNHFMKAALFLLSARKLFLECGSQADLLILEPDLNRLQTHLDQSNLDAAIAQAQAWTLEQAIAYALEEQK